MRARTPTHEERTPWIIRMHTNRCTIELNCALALQGGKGGGRQPADAVADEHADKTLDEMRTFAHFA